MGIELFVMFNEYYTNIEVEEIAKNDGTLQIYPNPNLGSFTINFNENFTGELTIYDITGKRVFSDYIFEQEQKFYSRGILGEGLYIIRITDEENQRLSSLKLSITD